MKHNYKCGGKRIGGLLMALAMTSTALLSPIGTMSTQAAGQEITKISPRLYQLDASVDLPYNYASVIGYKITFTLTKDNTDTYTEEPDLYCGYGGKNGAPGETDPNDPAGDPLGKFACYMMDFFKGAHDASEINSSIYGVENEGDNYEIIKNADLAKQEITKMGVGEGQYVAKLLENGKGYPETSGMKKGDSTTLTYESDQALFEQGTPYITVYGYTSEFEITDIEWITGTPVATKQEDWDPVEKETIADIETVETADHQNGSNYVNIIRPKDGDGPFPVILWIHGGAWVSSSRTDIILNQTMEYLLSQGYAFVSVEYTLGDRAEENSVEKTVNASNGKQMVYDIKTAIRFLRANEEKYNLDTRFITAMGESAGAHLATLMATTNGSKEHEAADTKTMDWKDYSSDVQAAVAYSTCSDLTGDCIETIEDSDKYKDKQYYMGTDAAGQPAYYDSVEEMVNTICYSDAYFAMDSDYVKAHSTYVDGKYTLDDEAYEAAAFLSPYCQLDADAAPMYIIQGEKDDALPIFQAYALEGIASRYMDADDIKTAFYPEAGHVDKSYFDVYAQYTETAKFINEKRDEIITTDAKDDAAKTETTKSNPIGVIIGVVVLAALVGIGVVIYKKKKNEK